MLMPPPSVAEVEWLLRTSAKPATNEMKHASSWVSYTVKFGYMLKIKHHIELLQRAILLIKSSVLQLIRKK